MEDWQKHVGPAGGVALCGARIGPTEWALTDADHARQCVEKGDRIQPCPDCWLVIETKAPWEGRPTTHWTEEMGERAKQIVAPLIDMAFGGSGGRCMSTIQCKDVRDGGDNDLGDWTILIIPTRQPDSGNA